MLNNIIIFFIILLILTLILYYSTEYKEGFFNFPDATHNAFVEDSRAKFNPLTNTINLVNPVIPVSADSSLTLKNALDSLKTEGTDTTFNLESSGGHTIPSSAPNTIKQAAMCETYGATCSAFDNADFAANCGISFDNKATGSNGKPHIGGLYVSPVDRQAQTKLATNVLNTGEAPYDPFKVYQPTIGSSTPGTFALTKDQCLVVKEKVDCATKQTFSSPNCAQCYTSQKFARVGPETQRIPSTLFLLGNGTVSITSENKSIALKASKLSASEPIQVTLPSDAEGNTFSILVEATTVPTWISGFLQGPTPKGTFTIDLMNLVEADQVSNSKPKINGSITYNGFKAVSIVPGVGKTSINLSCLMPFSFLSMYDGDALMCDNGPVITKAASATFLESDPCFGKDNQPGNYKLECLQSRWVELGGTSSGTGYPKNQAAADAIQKDANKKGLDIDTIINNLAPKINAALTGLDANNKPLSLADWNTVSIWATGVPINTPCDGTNKDNGPLSQECLSYLYSNQGVSSHIGATYTLPPSKVASMKNQGITSGSTASGAAANTYCQLGTSIDPGTTAGLKFGQSLGGINAVKQTYDQINRLANDNTKSNSERSDAINQCYGVTLDPIYTDNNTLNVYLNNGTISCNKYCGGVNKAPWNNELPAEWNGAKCTGVSSGITDCNSTFSYVPNQTYCVCTKTGTGWNQ